MNCKLVFAFVEEHTFTNVTFLESPSSQNISKHVTFLHNCMNQEIRTMFHFQK